jgi:hypothetical protein
MNSQIISKYDGTYLCETRIQDGTERWTEATEDAARKTIKKTEKILNGNKIKKKDIPLFKEEVDVRLVKIVKNGL